MKRDKPLRYCVTNQERGWAVQDIMRRPGDPTLEMFGKYYRAFKVKRDARQHRAEMNETLREKCFADCDFWEEGEK